jgi:hypothetical protein
MAIEFYEVTEETVDDVVALVPEFAGHSGDALKQYFLEQIKLRATAYSTLVVYKWQDDWQIMFVDNNFDIPHVMQQTERSLTEAESN